MTKLAKLLQAKGLPTRQLAVMSGIPERTVYRHVRGDATPTIKHAAAYARVLGCTVGDLVEEADS